MASAWSKIEKIETTNLNEIMSEEYARGLQDKEIKKYGQQLEEQLTLEFREPEVQNPGDTTDRKMGEIATKSELNFIPEEVLKVIREDASLTGTVFDDVCNSDQVIAHMLQSQFDREYNEELKRIEKHHNKDSKISISLDKYRRSGDMESDDESFEEYNEGRSKDWDRFETNEKVFDTIPKCGFKTNKEGEMITKHDPEICGVRNACRAMSFPPEISTGDGAGFDMKLSNRVYNQLKTYSKRHKKSKMHDRKENIETAEMGMDVRTRLLLYKLINNQILEQINGIISTGKEALILHANSDTSYIGDLLLPKECAIKIFKTTLNEFKQRDRYIKDDYRFKDRFSKQNNRVIIKMWAEKEMHNIMRMQNCGINCPDVVILKEHILVMSFIGDNHNAAPKLKNAVLTSADTSLAYEEIIQMMYKMYNEAKLVHADLSEYNILWYDGKCWFIDVAQSVEPDHPSALEFLMRDCNNIITFFKRRGLPNIYTKEELFEHITSLNAESHNAAMLERIHTRGASMKQATVPNLDNCPDEAKPVPFPFDFAWEKSQEDKKFIESMDSLSVLSTAIAEPTI